MSKVQDCPGASLIFENLDDVKSFLSTKTLNDDEQNQWIVNACREGSMDVLAYLVHEANFDLGAQDSLGRTCMHHVCQTDDPSLDKLKILLGTELDLMFRQDHEGKTPLDYVEDGQWNEWFKLPLFSNSFKRFGDMDDISGHESTNSGFSSVSNEDITEEEMIVHVTAILASRLEALQREHRESWSDAEDDLIQSELGLFVRMVAAMYRDVAYHSFDHAHHVTSATNDLLDMLVPPEDDENHPCSHDLFSNMNLRFAIVFAALIHDVDHTGTNNAQLEKEGDKLSVLYGGKSTLEKNSIVVGLLLFMSPELTNLRKAMFQTDHDFYEFRRIVVQLIMTTDIGNRETTKIIADAWEQAFDKDEEPGSHPPSREIDDNDRKRALAVIFYMMRAADVLHLMEDWDAFVKWSNLCYLEFRENYLRGQGEDPGSSWYENQIGFLDGYITPLAKKLHYSKAFGEFGEYMVDNIATNRERWLVEGK